MMIPMAELTLAELGVPPGHGCISTLSGEGDFRLTWDPADPDQVANARQAFADLRRSGHALYKIEGSGPRRQRDIIRTFDPAAGALQVVAVAPNRGG